MKAVLSEFATFAISVILIHLLTRTPWVVSILLALAAFALSFLVALTDSILPAEPAADEPTPAIVNL